MSGSGSSSLTDVLSYDDAEMNVRQFVDTFSSRLPLIINTTSGFTALNDPGLHEVGVDEVSPDLSPDLIDL